MAVRVCGQTYVKQEMGMDFFFTTPISRYFLPAKYGRKFSVRTDRRLLPAFLAVTVSAPAAGAAAVTASTAGLSAM